MKSSQYFYCCVIALVLFISHGARSQVSNYKAYTLFVYNFTKYLEWPEGAIGNEFVIGVYGSSPIVIELQKMVAVKKAGEKDIRIVELKEANSASTVHILFLPEESSGQLQKIVAAVKGKPVLLVTERQGLVQQGAGISFLSDNNSLKFELNSTSIASQNLKVSKTLAALAFKGSS